MFGKSPASMTDDQKRQQIDTMYDKARSAFPGIPETTVGEVMRRQAAGDALVLVDVRTPQEQEVSMIPGAITFDQFDAEVERHQHVTIVCYCTIGGRSGRATQELCARGLNASNMPGAVLQWSHEGGEFVDSEGDPTKRVHTHGPKFNLLAEGYEGVH